MTKRVTSTIIVFVVTTAIAALAVFAVPYYTTPAHIRNPGFEHFHFRTQMIIEGESLDFGEDKYQQEYNGDSCGTEISTEPFHFHDYEDQMTHIHWDGMTGGEFLKFYGWNFIGGPDDSLGRWYEGNMFSSYQDVEIHGSVLPNLADDAKLFIYIGDENGYEEKDPEAFISQDLETFFGVSSNLNQDTSWMEWFFPVAYAHGGADDEHHEEFELTVDQLTRINNLVGNLVIFAQHEEPTPQQVQERFNNLQPLKDSACGG